MDWFDDDYFKSNDSTTLQDVTFFNKYIKAGEEIADLGCGTGYVASLLEKEGYKIFGIEPSQVGFAKATALLEGTVVETDIITFLKNTGDTFENVILSGVLEYLDKKNFEWVINEGLKKIRCKKLYLAFCPAEALDRDEIIQRIEEEGQYVRSSSYYAKVLKKAGFRQCSDNFWFYGYSEEEMYLQDLWFDGNIWKVGKIYSVSPDSILKKRYKKLSTELLTLSTIENQDYFWVRFTDYLKVFAAYKGFNVNHYHIKSIAYWKSHARLKIVEIRLAQVDKIIAYEINTEYDAFVVSQYCLPVDISLFYEHKLGHTISLALPKFYSKKVFIGQDTCYSYIKD